MNRPRLHTIVTGFAVLRSYTSTGPTSPALLARSGSRRVLGLGSLAASFGSLAAVSASGGDPGAAASSSCDGVNFQGVSLLGQEQAINVDVSCSMVVPVSVTYMHSERL